MIWLDIRRACVPKTKRYSRFTGTTKIQICLAFEKTCRLFFHAPPPEPREVSHFTISTVCVFHGIETSPNPPVFESRMCQRMQPCDGCYGIACSRSYQRECTYVCKYIVSFVYFPCLWKVRESSLDFRSHSPEIVVEVRGLFVPLTMGLAPPHLAQPPPRSFRQNSWSTDINTTGSSTTSALQLIGHA